MVSAVVGSKRRPTSRPAGSPVRVRVRVRVRVSLWGSNGHSGSASWRSEGLSRRQIVLQAAPSFGQPPDQPAALSPFVLSQTSRLGGVRGFRLRVSLSVWLWPAMHAGRLFDTGPRGWPAAHAARPLPSCRGRSSLVTGSSPAAVKSEAQTCEYRPVWGLLARGSSPAWQTLAR